MVPGMLTLNGGWGMQFWEKVRVQNGNQAQKPAWKDYAGSLKPEIKQNQH